jgi:hypothetical protein
MPSRLRSVPRLTCGVLALCVHLAAAQPATSPPAPGSSAALTCEQMETFLRTAKVIRERHIPVGVTSPVRLTLEQHGVQHDAAAQTIDDRKAVFRTKRTELNFRDSWQFNVAGYEVAKMLALNMVPPYVERRMRRGRGSLSWWIPDAMMERDRTGQKLSPPDPERWNKEMYAVRVFQELIGDTDLNMTNILITRDWRIWMIDFTRAFRQTKALQKPAILHRVDRRLLANLRELNREALQRQVGRWLAPGELDAVLARRDLLVRHFDEAIASRSEVAVLYDIDRTSEPCGQGL